MKQYASQYLNNVKNMDGSAQRSAEAPKNQYKNNELQNMKSERFVCAEKYIDALERGDKAEAKQNEKQIAKLTKEIEKLESQEKSKQKDNSMERTR